MSRRKDHPAGGPVFLAYFSRPGENYSYGGRTFLTVGNTKLLADKIAARLDCDVYRIEAADPYPDDYDATVARNVREQEDEARPAIAGPLPSALSWQRYGTVLLGSPVWNVAAPMIMRTFAEALDFRGKTVAPFTTHAMSGLGTAPKDYATSCPGATIAIGLAVRGEEAGDPATDTAVDTWLHDLGLIGERS
ncbi:MULTISPECIES: flavodoxin [unclassified Streptomyces]|uniref:flavodoxin n=1 Tax=unclassified Streptomyces TaxID=2593676 RepID=UPI00165556B1|nr:flavodoxin [Streptomyces sp. CB02980]MCB8902059.1 hypothetical protein [Streptomyces sp. CB02980]